MTALQNDRGLRREAPSSEFQQQYRIGVPELGKRWSLLFVFTFVYYVVGCLYYKFGSDLDWNILQAVYFTTISITTIGYGDEVPYSVRDKIFTMVYTSVGILVVMNSIAQAVGVFFETIERAAMRRRALRTASATRRQKNEASGRRRRSLSSSSPLALFCYREVSWLFWGLALMLVGTVVLYLAEGYTFVDAMFWAFQTCTTIGYGNTRVRTRGVRAFVVPYALFSSIGWAYVIAKMVGTSADQAYLRKREALLQARLDHALVMCLDRDGDGVDKAEFIVGMLRILGHVTDEDVEPWFRRFDELDLTKSGRLDSTNLAVIAREAAIEARARHSRVTEDKGWGWPKTWHFMRWVVGGVANGDPAANPGSSSSKGAANSDPLYTPFITPRRPEFPRGASSSALSADSAKFDDDDDDAPGLPTHRGAASSLDPDDRRSFADSGKSSPLSQRQASSPSLEA